MADVATITRVFPASRDGVLSDVRRFVAEEGGNVVALFVHDLQLAVTEACANAIVHSGTSEIRVSIRPVGSRCVEIVVEDDGVYRTHLPAADGDATGHRGMFLMAALVDEITLRRGTDDRHGTVVRLLKCSAA
jgi:anti-sigma regulatory factor (Ser/Thr protein kinase)